MNVEKWQHRVKLTNLKLSFFNIYNIINCMEVTKSENPLFGVHTQFMYSLFIVYITILITKIKS